MIEPLIQLVLEIIAFIVPGTAIHRTKKDKEEESQ
jgi:hypothetical protein